MIREYIRYAVAQGYDVDRKGNVYSFTGKKMKPYLGSNGYKCISVYNNDKRMTVTVHRIIAYKKFGEESLSDNVYTRHLNGCKTDNRWENISIGTQSDNIMDRPKEARKKHALSAGLSKSPLSPEDVLEIVEIVKGEEHETYQKLAESKGLKSKSTISDIMNGNIWSHVTGL